MTDFSNFGCLLYSVSGSTSTVLAGLVKLDPPEVKNEKIDTTNHSSGNVKTCISGCLVEYGDIKGTFSYSDTTATTLYNSCVTGNMGHYKITFPNAKNWSFSALVTSFAYEGMDAQNPELLQYSTTFAPSGSMVIS